MSRSYVHLSYALGVPESKLICHAVAETSFPLHARSLLIILSFVAYTKPHSHTSEAKLLLDSTQLTLQLPTFFFPVLNMKHEQFCQTLEKTPTPSQASTFILPPMLGTYTNMQLLVFRCITLTLQLLNAVPQ
jgi:hypothetical protein